MAATFAPRCNTANKSDAMHYVTDVGSSLSANLDLTSISGKPKWAPQKMTFWTTAGTAQALVVIDESDVTHTLAAPANGYVVVCTRPMKTLVDSGAGDVEVMFEWFDPNGSTAWNK